MESNPNRGVCPSDTDNKTKCNQVPNAVWVPAVSGSVTEGVCYCCKTDGSSYVNTSSITPESDPCMMCPSNAVCGDQDGFCKGDTGNPMASCVQDSGTLLWSADCSNVKKCGGLCSGNCGLGEWFLFQSCRGEDDKYNCVFDVGQWRSWLVYGVIFFIFLVILICIFR